MQYMYKNKYKYHVTKSRVGEGKIRKILYTRNRKYNMLKLFLRGC